MQLELSKCYSAVFGQKNKTQSAMNKSNYITRMRLVGNDREPLDLSREDHLKVFTESMQEWHQIVAASKDDSKYGFVIVNGIKLQPFGTVYSEIEAQ